MKSAFIHVTNACNLTCQHCAYSSGKKFTDELSYSDIIKLATILKKSGGHTIMIGGGEPLLRPDIETILNTLSDLDMDISVETNLTVNSPIIKKLHTYKKLKITTSIDSMNENDHDAFRGKKGAFQTTLSNITYLRSKNIPIRLNALILKTNMHEIDDYLNFAKKTGVIFRPLMRLIDSGRATNLKSIALEPKDIRHILEKIFLFIENGNEKLVTLYLPPALIPPKYIKFKYLCDWGNFIGVSANGNIGLCPAAYGIDELMGNHISEIINGKTPINNIGIASQYKKFNCNQLTGICKKCVAREYCRGGCRVDAYLTYGSTTAPDPICQKFYDQHLFPQYALEQEKKGGI